MPAQNPDVRVPHTGVLADLAVGRELLSSPQQSAAIAIEAGHDRMQRNDLMIWGFLPLAIKLSGADTDGQILLFEHRDMGKGGPPRHVHLDQDEWFYVVKGEYAFEVGDKAYRLQAGGTFFAPRMIPHAWANVGDTPGTLLTMVSPVGSFETFILETTRRATVPSPEEMEICFAQHGMKLVGAPLLST